MSGTNESPKSKRILAYSLVSVGLVLVVVGLMWNRLVPAEQYWNEQDNEEFVQAYSDAHAASSGHTHDEHSDEHDDHEPPDLETARQHLSQVQGRLETARTLHDYSGRVISIAGLIFAVSGAALLRKYHQ